MSKKPHTVPEIKPAKTKNYLNNKDFLASVIEAKRQDKLTDDLANKFMLLVKKYASKANFSGYSYNDDMQSVALVTLVKTWRSFNEKASNNPFAYYTQCIKNCFIQQILHEKNIQRLKNKQLVERGLNPSLSFILEHDKDYLDRRATMHTSDAYVSEQESVDEIDVVEHDLDLSTTQFDEPQTAGTPEIQTTDMDETQQ